MNYSQEPNTLSSVHDPLCERIVPFRECLLLRIKYNCGNLFFLLSTA